MELQDNIKRLFKSTNIQVERLNPEVDNTNYVFEAYTDNESCIIRIPKSVEALSTSIFWQGLEKLFGLNIIESIKNQSQVSDYLRQYGTIPVPSVFEFNSTNDNPIGIPYVMMETMDGEPIPRDSDLEKEITQSSECMRQLGEHLGSIHRQQADYFGTLEQHKFKLEQFPEQLSATIRMLGNTPKALQDTGVQELLARYIEASLNMQPPEFCTLIMPDLWASQFLTMDGLLSTCIDIEACVVAPPALELALIELWIGPLGKFKEGYLGVNNQWPEDLEEHRDIYRFFLFLLYGCPPAGLDACLDSRGKFPQRQKVRARISAPRLVPPGYPFS